MPALFVWGALRAPYGGAVAASGTLAGVPRDTTGTGRPCSAAALAENAKNAAEIAARNPPPAPQASPEEAKTC
jgi:hypothetical protein